jgi:hypothetical protein
MYSIDNSQKIINQVEIEQLSLENQIQIPLPFHPAFFPLKHSGLRSMYSQVQFFNICVTL